MSTASDAVLERASRGEATFEEVARALAEIEHLTVLLEPGDFRRFLDDLDAAVREKGVGNVTVRDAAAPQQIGITTADGFVPQVFTDDGLAREFALASGMIEADDALAFTAVRPRDLLHECLARGHAGLVLDDRSQRKINLHRPTIARLYALMTRDEFAGAASLHAVTRGGTVLYQRPQGAAGLQAVVYDSAEAAAEGLSRVGASDAGLATVPMETGPLLALLLGAGVTMLVVNAGLPTARHYDRDDLASMAHGVPPGARAADGPPREPAVEPHGPGDAPRRVGGSPHAPPGRDHAAARARFQELHRQAEARSIGIWEYVEALAFDLDYHVPVHSAPVEGCRWPMLWRHPHQEGKTIALAFSSAPLLEQSFADVPPAERRHVHVAGIEAMRWSYAAPRRIDEIGIDLYPDSEAWITFPESWTLAAVYPQIAAFDDLAQVARVGLGRIGGLPGARGLKPEVVRALVEGWRELVALDGDGPGGPAIVEHRGGRYLPVFTDQKQYSAFCAVHRDRRARPLRAGATAPFGAWLVAAARLDGVLLDPAGPWPLALDTTDLLVLDLWTRAPALRPRGPEIVAEVARLHAAGALTGALAGAIVADWPQWFIGLAQADGQAHVLAVPFEKDACALFTTEQAAAAFLAAHRDLALLEIPEGMAPVALVHRWQHSVFRLVREQFTSAWVDPVARGGAILVLDQEMLAAAAARVEERLCPRVPGFVAGD